MFARGYHAQMFPAEPEGRYFERSGSYRKWMPSPPETVIEAAIKGEISHFDPDIIAR